MLTCPDCKSNIDEDSLYCDQCGNELKVCPDCGVLGRLKCCTQCGAKLILKSLSESHDTEYVLTLVDQLSNERLELVDKAIIGRKAGAYLSFFSNQSYVSGRHASLAYDPSSKCWSITDLDSTNGTFVNGDRLLPDKPCRLSKKDCVKIANLEFIVG